MKKTSKIIVLIIVLIIAVILAIGIYSYLNRSSGSEMIGFPRVPCDIDWNGNCDERDFIMANQSSGKCLGDRYYERFADINRDDCVTEEEVQKLFPERFK